MIPVPAMEDVPVSATEGVAPLLPLPPTPDEDEPLPVLTPWLPAAPAAAVPLVEDVTGAPVAVPALAPGGAGRCRSHSTGRRGLSGLHFGGSQVSTGVGLLFRRALVRPLRARCAGRH